MNKETPSLFYEPSGGPLRVAGLMSGSGTNIDKLIERGREIERREGRPAFEVVVLFSDDALSKATDLGRRYGIPTVTHDLGAFCARRGVARRDLIAREEFDRQTVQILQAFGVRLAAFGGYMSVATKPLVDAFLGVNVHPADLSVELDGRRRFTGAHAVADAIAAGESWLRSTAHLVEETVDGGRLLFRSASVAVARPENFDPSDKAALKTLAQTHQERLKRVGDWTVFSIAVEAIARGRLAQNEKGEIFLDGFPIPTGATLFQDAP